MTSSLCKVYGQENHDKIKAHRDKCGYDNSWLLESRTRSRPQCSHPFALWEDEFMRLVSDETVRENDQKQPIDVHGLSLHCNFAWTLVGNTVYSACQWAMLVLLARLSPPETVGRLALGFALTAPIFMLASLQLRAVQATDAKRKYLFGHYLALRLATTLLALGLTGAATITLGYRGETVTVILVVAFAKALEAVSDVLYGLLQQHERMDRIAVSMILRGLGSLAAFGGALYASGSLLWGLAALATVWAIVLGAYDLRSGRMILQSGVNVNSASTLRPQWNFSLLGRLALISFPLGVVMMLISLNANIPRYVIERYLGESDLGVFAALAALLVAGNTIVAALGQSAGPRLARYYAAADRAAFRQLLLKLLATGALLGALGIAVALLAGRPLLELLYGSEYATYTELLGWITVAAAISYVQSFVGYAVTAARYFAVQAPLLACVSALTVVLCLWLIPTYGLFGASLALVGSALIHLVGSLLILAHALSQLRSLALVNSSEVLPQEL